MARKKTALVRVNAKAQISQRLREIRQEQFGDHGGPELARALNLPARTWYNYETGVTVPAEILLSFIDKTGTNPLWLLTGRGPRFRSGVEDQVLDNLTPLELIRRGLEKLETHSSDVVLVAGDESRGERETDFIALPVHAMDSLGVAPTKVAVAKGQVVAQRSWIAHPRDTFAVQIEDDSMAPVLAAGSVAAIDRTCHDPHQLQGKIVAACPDGHPMIRWLDLSGRHLILRPNQQTLEYPITPTEWNPDRRGGSPIVGQVVCAWSQFAAP